MADGAAATQKRRGSISCGIVTIGVFLPHDTRGYGIITNDEREKKPANPRRGVAGVAAAVMGWQLYRYLFGMHNVTSGLVLIAIVCAPLFGGTFSLALSFGEASARRRVVRTVLATLFGFYLAALLGAFDFFAHRLLHFSENAAAYREHFDLNTNFRPLETVFLYLRALKYNYIGSKSDFQPDRQHAAVYADGGVSAVPVSAHAQTLGVCAGDGRAAGRRRGAAIALSCGSCDVDDVLLNFAGTMAVYGVIKIPAVDRLLQRLFLMPEPAGGRKTEPSPDFSEPSTER
jgi:hypothetical protein